MLKIFFILTFVFCIAFAAYGILIANSLKDKKHAEFISQNIFVQQILIYVFGFYGIWGYILSRVIFNSYVTSNLLLEKIAVSITFWAIPFLLASWWFLLQVSNTLLQIKRKKVFTTIILLISVLLSFSIVLLNKSLPTVDLSFKVYIIGNSILTAYLLISIIISKVIEINPTKRVFIISVYIAIAILLAVSAYFYNLHQLVAAFFILLFFISNTWISFSFNYMIIYPESRNIHITGSFNSFCEKYTISNRESEIIKLICEGLTNKEIAEKLFITTQTVKDHTSRIYLKTEVKNRTQLANLVREYS